MSQMITVIISVLMFIGTITVSLIGYFLRKTMDDLKDVRDLSIKTKGELDVLNKDHDNKYDYITDKFDDLKQAIEKSTNKTEKLTSKIEELTAKIK